MKFQYLGTAAGEGLPALFCECDVCKEAKRRGGKDIRTRSQALINEELLIDFPADTYMHYLNGSFNMARVRDCLITHSHFDHLYAAEFWTRAPGIAHRKEDIVITVYAGKSGCKLIRPVIDSQNLSEKELVLKEVSKFQPFPVNGYQITALTATHAVQTDPVVYIIEKDGKSVFYVHDSSDFPQETWDYLETYKGTFDLVSLDCTEGDRDITYPGHMNVKRCRDMKDRLICMGLANGNTRFVLNHFSHNGYKILHDELEAFVKPYGFDVAYDGLTIEL